MEGELLWLVVTTSVALNGTLLALGYKSIVNRLDEIKKTTDSLPAIATQVGVNARDITRHEGKLDDLQKNKADRRP